MAGDLSTLKPYIDQGDYQTAYNQARAAGYGLNDIASFVNQNYGTKFSDSDFMQYEPGSMANLNANNYRYATYSNGIGQGTPYSVPTVVNNPGLNAFNMAPITSADTAKWSNNPADKLQAQQVQNRGSGGTVVGGTPGVSSTGGVPNLPNLTNYAGSTPSTDLSLGLPSLYPRRRADQSFNRGNNYFNMGSGNYTNRFA